MRNDLKEGCRGRRCGKRRGAAIRSGARKLNLVAASIRGKNAAAALTQLAFSAASRRT